MKIRGLFLDVDGVLTDGFIWIGPGGEEWYRVSVHDGWALRWAAQNGLYVAVFSGRSHPQLHPRLMALGVDFIAENLTDKKSAVEAYMAEKKLTWAEISYMGDDMADQAVLEAAGFSACPANAVPAIKAIVDWVSDFRGGEGAIRQWVEKILSGL